MEQTREQNLAAADSNSIKLPFICRGGRSNRLGRAREVCSAAQRSHLHWVLHGFTICAPHPPTLHPPSSSSSPSSHMFLPPTNVRSNPPPPPPPRHTSQRRRIKKTHKSFPWLPSGLPGQGSGRENSEKKNRGGGCWEERGEELCVCVCWRYMFFIPAQVSFTSPPDVTLTHVKHQEEEEEEAGGKKRLKLENLIYLIISQNN